MFICSFYNSNNIFVSRLPPEGMYRRRNALRGEYSARLLKHAVVGRHGEHAKADGVNIVIHRKPCFLAHSRLYYYHNGRHTKHSHLQSCSVS